MKEVFLILLLFCTPFSVNGNGNFGEFLYFYQGVLAMGAPELKPQYSGTMMQMGLFIQMKTPTRGIAQMRNISTYTFNREQSFKDVCNPADKYMLSPLVDYKEKFEKTFAVNLDPKAMVRMMVDEDEEEFITNIRKSVIDTIVNRKYPDETKNPRFTKEEETIFGKCPVQFSSVKEVPKSYISTLESNFLDKFNASSHIISKIHGGNPRESAQFVKGVIDFDRCEDPVVVQRTNIGNLTKSTKEMFNSILSRLSSQQEFTLFANGTIPIMFTNRKTGHSLFNPFGFQTEKFSVLTCQNFLGLGPYPIKKPLRLPPKTKEIKTGLFQVASSFPRGRKPKPWINYYNHAENQYPITEFFMTGIKASPKLIRKALTKMRQLISNAADCLLEDSSSELKPATIEDTDHCLTYIKDATKLAKIIHLNDAKEMYQSFIKQESKFSVSQQLQSELFIDILAAAGTTTTTRILLSLFSLNGLPTAREASIWITMANQLESPEVVDELVKFVTNPKPLTPIVLLSTRLVSMATIVNRLCADPSSREYSVERVLYGSKACNREDALRTLVSYLKKSVKVNLNLMKEPYLVQALSNLASPKDTFDIFESIIHKKILLAKDDQIRTLAVYALEKRKMGEAMREKAFSLLMTIFIDLTETDEVRQSSFITMLTWEPESSWWHRMAKRTWVEPSQEVAAFMYSSMKSLSESTSLMLMKQSNIVSFVLPLAKPQPATISKSYNLVLGSYLYREKIDTRFHLEWLPYPFPSLNYFPREIYTHLSTSFGGVDFNLFEVALSQYNLMINHPPEAGTKKDFTGINHDMLKGIKNIITQISANENLKMVATANLLLRAFDNLYVFLPLKYPIRFNITSDGVDQIMENGRHLTKFFIPTSSEMAIPTEIGLPIVFETSSSFLGYLNLVNITDRCGKINPNNHCYQIPFDLRVSTKVTSEIKSFLPWSNETIKVGVENSKTLRLPLNVTYGINFEKKGTLGGISFTSILNKKFSIMSSKNIPYTSIEKMLPVEDDQIVSKKILNLLDSPLNKGALNLTSNVTNLNIFLNYESDVDLPFSSANFIELIKKPERILTWLASPTLKQSNYSLDNDPTISEKNYVRLIYIEDRYYEDDSDELLKTKEGPNMVPVINRIKNIFFKSEEKRNKNITSGGNTKFIILDFLDSYEQIQTKFMINGYAIVLGYYSGKPINDVKMFSFDFLFSQLSVTNKNNDMMINNGPYHFNYQTNIPVIYDHDSYARFLHNSNGTTFQGGLYINTPNHGPAKTLLTYKGTFKMSETQRSRLLGDLKDNCILYGPVLVDLNSILTYEEANLTVNYYLENFNTKTLNYTHQLKDWIIGIYYPYYSSTRLVENMEGFVEVTAKRMTEAEDYAVHIKMPKEQILISRFQFPLGLNKFINLLNQKDYLPVVQLRTSEYCQIQKDWTKRYDGLRANFPITSCPVLLSIDYTSPMDWVLLGELNQKKHLQLMLISSHEIEVLITKDTIMVNGEVIKRSNETIVIKDSSGEPILKISPLGSAIDFLHHLCIENHHSDLRIYPNPRLVGKVAGLCGNFYGNSNVGMLGPQGCVYNSTKLLGASWTVMTDDDKCLKEKWLMELQHENEMFTQTCAKN